MRALTIAAAITVLTISSGFSAAQPIAGSEPIITVHGQGRAQVPPDHANLTAEVVTKGKSLESAATAHRDRASRAAGALRDMKKDGLEIQRSVFRLNEVRLPSTPASPRGETEYQAVTSFELKITRLDSIDRVMTALATTGLFEMRNLSFGIDEKNAGLTSARRNAFEDARGRAATYAEAAGVALGDVIRIDDTDSRSPREFAMAAPMARGMQVTPPENLTLSASVTVTWRIRNKP